MRTWSLSPSWRTNRSSFLVMMASRSASGFSSWCASSFLGRGGVWPLAARRSAPRWRLGWVLLGFEICTIIVVLCYKEQKVTPNNCFSLLCGTVFSAAVISSVCRISIFCQVKSPEFEKIQWIFLKKHAFDTTFLQKQAYDSRDFCKNKAVFFKLLRFMQKLPSHPSYTAHLTLFLHFRQC